jgi:thioredoxin-like negative regulator of GroEL
MATEVITIEVDSEAARAFKTAPPEEQKKIEALLSLRLKEIATANVRALEEVMDDIGKEAQQKGLTPKILESILHEE